MKREMYRNVAETPALCIIAAKFLTPRYSYVHRNTTPILSLSSNYSVVRTKSLAGKLRWLTLRKRNQNRYEEVYFIFVLLSFFFYDERSGH